MKRACCVPSADPYAGMTQTGSMGLISAAHARGTPGRRHIVVVFTPRGKAVGLRRRKGRILPGPTVISGFRAILEIVRRPPK
jgi:hypothetical protein